MLHKFTIVALLCVGTLAACVADKNQSDNGSVPQIRSTQELETYLRATPSSPLNRLSTDAKDRFVSSLVFTDKGLGSFRYSELQVLPAEDIEQVLSLFGIERTLSLITKDTQSNFEEISSDHEGYWCSSAATCSLQAGSICTSNC